ncbi:MAG: hypothetical protein H8E98_06080 [Bacteroidetes bacterium]|nr:hypothetical protein [Bacteroidota bacterium]
MAVNIPIWDGSPGIISGSTPFGFYDDDSQFQTDGPKFAKFCAKRLGYPIMDVELQSGSLYTAFEEAITEYSHQVNQFNIRENLLSLQGTSTGSNLTHRVITPNLGMVFTISEQYGTEAGTGGAVKYHTGSIAVSSSIQRYDLDVLYKDHYHSGDQIEIKKVYHEAKPAIVRYFDPYVGSGLGSQNLLDSFGWGAYSPAVSFLMMPMYADILRIQAIEFNDQIRKSGYSFELINNEIRIFPIPTTDYRLYFDYIVKSDRSDPLKLTNQNLISDVSNAGYQNMQYKFINSVGKRWINKYGLAVAKEMLGWIRSKYNTVPIPDNEITLNGDALITSAETEKQHLIEELQATLEESSRTKLLEKRKDESEFIQEEMNRVPTYIYIG